MARSSSVTRLRLRIHAVWDAKAEILASIALLAGWGLVTWGFASLLVWQVWPISAGVLMLSLFGWRLLATVAREGLYALTRTRRG